MRLSHIVATVWLALTVAAISFGQEVDLAIGRDHHIEAFTMWLAGGGVKSGSSYGGIDHEKLTYRFRGRDSA